MMGTTISGDKMFSHLDRVMGDHRPITADIFLTNYCNNACPYCTYRRWGLEKGSHSMSYDEFVSYAERLLELGVLGFILTGGGEPTVAQDFKRICQWMENKGIHYGINTNFNRLEFIRPDYLKVSLDGWDEESYQRHRGVRRYDLVKKNVQAYSAWKRDHSPGTSLGIQCVVEHSTDILKFYEANSGLDVDYIVFRPLESTGGSAYKDARALDDAEKTIQLVGDLARSDPRVNLNFKWHLLGEHEASCVASWSQIALDERGNVIFCCHKPYQKVGHILDDDILKKKERAKTDMATCDIPCRLTAPNSFVAKAQADRKGACFI